MILVGKIEINGTTIPDNLWHQPHFLSQLPGHSWDSFPNFLSWMETMTHLDSVSDFSLRGINAIPDEDPTKPEPPAIEFWLDYLEKNSIPPHSVVSIFLTAENDPDRPDYDECDVIITRYS